MEAFDLNLWPGFVSAGGDPATPCIIDQIVIDSRRVSSANALFVALQGKQSNGHLYIAQAAQEGAAYALVDSTYTPPPTLAHMRFLYVADPLAALGEIAQAYRAQFSIPVIAICGSYGKTMLKDLLVALFASNFSTVASPESFNSQLGVSLSLLNIDSSHQMALIEAGFSQPGEMELLQKRISPTHVVITNAEEKHLATLKDQRVIGQEILSLTQGLSQQGWVLLPETPFLPLLTSVPTHYWNKLSEALPHVVIAKEATHEIHYDILFPQQEEPQKIFRLSVEREKRARLGNQHYFLDLLNCALRTCWLFGLTSENICQVLEGYQPEEMFTEIWRSPTGITIINDTYAADPLSIARSLRHLPAQGKRGKKLFLFSGLRPSGLSSSTAQSLASEMGHAHIDQLLFYGIENFPLLEKFVKQLSPLTETHQYASKEAAWRGVKDQLQHGDILLIKGREKENLEQAAAALCNAPSENRLLIHFGAIRANLELLRSLLPPKMRLMIMIKAGGYGTDPALLGKFLTTLGIDLLGVAHIDEAVSLREQGLDQDIFVIHAPHYEADKLIKYNFEVGVSDLETLYLFAQEAQRIGKVIKVHLHIDTGMRRLGCRPEEALSLALKIQELPSLSLEGVMSHFAAADSTEHDAFSEQQLAKFEEIIKQLREIGIAPRWVHMANSHGALRFPSNQCNMVRLGLAPLGLGQLGPPLKPALSLHSRITGINHCYAGESVSYGRSYTVSGGCARIGVLPLGYFDGLHRHYSGKGYVLLHGQRAPMVGRICMDFMMIDITHIPQATVGDPVLIFGIDQLGNTLSAEEVALWGNTDVRELITCLGPRILRIFMDDQ